MKYIWDGMIGRCHRPNHHAFKNYGARGISVCNEWRDYEVFVADVVAEIGPRPEAATLDRIDNNGNYEPGNIRWLSRRDQMINRQRNGHSKYRGVSKHRCGKFQAMGGPTGDQVYLGLHVTEEGAALAYDDWARDYYGPDWAGLNFTWEEAKPSTDKRMDPLT